MRKILRIALALATAVAALLSCTRVQKETPAERTVQFTAGAPETRTVFIAPEGDSYPVRWTNGDLEVRISLNMLETRGANVEPAADGKSARFYASFSNAYEAPYYFDLLSPSSAYVRDHGGKWEIRLPDEQESWPQSVDPEAQILVAQAGPFDQMPGSVAFSPKHWTAYGILTFENLSVGTAAVSRIEVTSEKPLAGRWTYDTHDGTSAPDDAAVNTVKIKTGVTENVWFACAPVDLSGTKLTFKVVTEIGDFVKEVTLPAGRNLTSGTVARIKVDMSGITPQGATLSFSRVIKYFPPAWPSVIGLSAGQDRTAAMDEEYIYVSRTGAGGVKGVKAISLADPSVVKDVNMEGVEGGDFITSCVRTIYDPVRGKRILLLSSMAESWGYPVRIYAFENGIDNPPTLLVNFEIGAYRRFGDFFTVVGDYQHGYLWFRNFLSEDTEKKEDIGLSARFELVEGRAKNQWPDAFKIGYAQSYGMGSLYQYGMAAKQILLVTDRFGLCYKFTDPVSEDPWGQNMDKGPFCRMYGIKPFELGGKKFIAYVKMKNDNAARSWLRVIPDTGDFKADLENSIKAEPTNLLYQAAVQIDEEGPSVNVVTPGATWSDKTMANCDVVVKDGAAYILAHHHNVGLSVFKMTIE